MIGNVTSGSNTPGPLLIGFKYMEKKNEVLENENLSKLTWELYQCGFSVVCYRESWGWTKGWSWEEKQGY